MSKDQQCLDLQARCIKLQKALIERNDQLMGVQDQIAEMREAGGGISLRDLKRAKKYVEIVSHVNGRWPVSVLAPSEAGLGVLQDIIPIVRDDCPKFVESRKEREG